MLVTEKSYALAFIDGGYDDNGFRPYRTYISYSPFEHVDPYSGNLILTHTDISLPGNGSMHLEISRIYNSKQIYVPFTGSWIVVNGAMGMGWDLFFGRLIPWSQPFLPEAALTLSDGTVMQVYENNHENVLNNTGAGYVTEDFSVLEYYENTDEWVMIQKDGTVYYFDQQVTVFGAPGGVHYYPTAITDTADNSIEIEYYDCCNIVDNYNGGKLGSCPGSSSTLRKIPHIKSVKDSAGRIINFNWLNNSCRSSANPNAIASIDYGENTYIYIYDPVYDSSSGELSGYLLKEVIPPEGNPWIYGYNWGNELPRGEIQSVTYPWGGMISYAFSTVFHNPQYHVNHFQSSIPQRSRVLSSRTVSGPGIKSATWNYSYGFPHDSNVAEVTEPCNRKIKYYFHTAMRNSYSGNWAVSLLYRKEITDLNGDVFEINSVDIKPYQVSINLNTIEKGFFTPLVSTTEIVRDNRQYTKNFEYGTFYAHPTRITESGDASRVTVINYFENTENGNHLIGLPATVHFSSEGEAFSIHNIYDFETGRLLSNDRYGVLTEYGYHDNGNISWIRNARGFFTHYDNYIYGSAGLIKYGSSTSGGNDPVVTEAREVSFYGEILNITNGRGFTTSFEYDAANRLIRVIPPQSGEATTEIEYDLISGRQYRIKKGSNTILYETDGFGRILRTTTGTGIINDTEYGICGEITYRSLPYDGSTPESGNSFSYDVLDRLEMITRPDGTKQEFTYSGNTVLLNNERDESTLYTYNSFGDPDEKRLVTVRDPGLNTTNYEYNLLGSITRITPPSGVERVYEYNSKNFLVSMTDPETGTTLYTYDLSGNLIYTQKSNGKSLMYQYDRLDRLTVKRYDDNDVFLSYDESNNLTSVAAGNGAYHYEYDYDESNRLVRKYASLNYGWLEYQVEYDYDELNNITQAHYPSGETVMYEHDPESRISGIKDDLGNYYLGNVNYHPSGLPFNYITAFGVSTDFSYDNRHRLRTLQVKRPYPELRILKDGSGSGNVRSTNIEGINCGNNCSQVYTVQGIVVTLVASENADSAFSGWSGDGECRGTNREINVLIDSNKTCIAVFSRPGDQKKLSVTKRGSGSGSVVSDPEGINCGAECEGEFELNSNVTLRVYPESDSEFTGWSGDTECQSGVVLMDDHRECIATFEKVTHRLSIEKRGAGRGSVTSSPDGIDCGEICEYEFDHGTNIVLTSNPYGGFVFQRWTGDPRCSSGTFILESDIRCIAVFLPSKPQGNQLTVYREGTGSGTVTSRPPGIDCGNDCTAVYNSGTRINLTAVPDQGSVFKGWTGNDDCSDGIITMNSSVSCSAVFDIEESPGFPDITYTLSPEPYGEGWYGKQFLEHFGEIVVNFECHDNSGSGIASCTDQVSVSEEGVHEITGTATDNKGNSTTVTAVVKIDLTPPTAQITNYREYDVAKPDEVSILPDGTILATISGTMKDELSGPYMVQCSAFFLAPHRLLHDSDLKENYEEIDGENFNCDVSLVKHYPNHIYVTVYDRAFNFIDLGEIVLRYYGDDDTEPPTITMLRVDNNSCYDSDSDIVRVRVSATAGVTDDLSGPDYDTSDMTWSGNPDFSFGCSRAGSGNSLCSGGGDMNSNIYNNYQNFKMLKVLNTEETSDTSFTFVIYDYNGNRAEESFVVDFPPIEELPSCS